MIFRYKDLTFATTLHHSCHQSMNQKSKINTKKKNKNIRVKKQGDFALPEETKPNQVFELL